MAEQECSVCLVDIPLSELLTTKCLHAFHRLCILKVMRFKDECPCCRQSPITLDLPNGSAYRRFCVETKEALGVLESQEELEALERIKTKLYFHEMCGNRRVHFTTEHHIPKKYLFKPPESWTNTFARMGWDMTSDNLDIDDDDIDQADDDVSLVFNLKKDKKRKVAQV